MGTSPEFENFDRILEEYNTAQQWLLSLVTDPSGNRYLIEKSTAQRLAEYEKQLRQTAAFLDFLGNPQDSYKSIHIAGTGGKGSVTTMIGSLLQETGSRVGIHTSPYLQVPNEKLLVNRKMVSPSKFTDLVNNFKQQYQKFIDKYPSLTPRYVDETDLRQLHLAVKIDEDPQTRQPLLIHATSIEGKVTVWPLSRFSSHSRYEKLFATKRLKRP